jgi:hypothetical protein
MTHDSRLLALNDFKAPSSQVATGVRFRISNSVLYFQMRVSKIDFATGKIISPEMSYWMGELKYETNNNPFYWPNVPTKSTEPSTALVTKDNSIEFTYSDVGTDAAQTTIPFLDAQDVASNPPVPLEGVGIFLKGQSRNSGVIYNVFVAPKITTYDYSK